MLLIIAHHLAVHTSFTFENVHIKYIVYFLSLGGKIGVNSFILLTGYLLIDKKINLKNLYRIWIDVLFYLIVIQVFFYFYDSNYFSNDIKILFFPITYYWFIRTYFIMSIILYFLDFNYKERKRYLKFIITLIVFWSIISPVFNINLDYSNVLWFILLYFIGGYIKLYVKKIKNNYWYLCGSIFFYFLIFIRTINSPSVFEENQYIITRYIGMDDFFVLLASIFLILFFSNLDVSYNKYINIVSSTTFGIYLIHDNGSVRSFLWNNYFRLFEITKSKDLILNSIGIIFLIFFICMIIDLIRKFIIEILLKKKIDQFYGLLLSLNNKIDKII
jgi:Acyltransferase family.